MQHGTDSCYQYHKCRCDDCKAAHAEYQRQYAVRTGWWKQRRQAMKVWIDELKSAPCSDCGNTYPPECMDFDHRPGETKLFEVGSKGGYSRAKIEAEIAKCDLVCANCHRIRTRQRRDA